MRKGLMWLVLACWVMGCQTTSEKTTVLTTEQFLKHFAGPAAVETNEVNAAGAKPKIIAPGMQISIFVDEDRSLNRQYLVPPGGVLDVPGGGRLNVVGLTAEEVTDKVRVPLERDFFKKATVTVVIDAVPTQVLTGGGIIYVLRNFYRPGPIMLPQGDVFTVMKG